MYIICGGCGRVIAEQEAECVTMKHRGRVVRIRDGDLGCECGTTTLVHAGRPITPSGDSFIAVNFADVLA